MTSLMPETIPPVEQSPNSSIYEDPAPKAKTPRKSWTQAEVAALVRSYEKCQSNDVLMFELMFEFPERFGFDESIAKLVALGVAKPEPKATLSRDSQEQVDDYVLGLTELPEPQKTLALKYAAKLIGALLRPVK